MVSPLIKMFDRWVQDMIWLRISRDNEKYLQKTFQDDAFAEGLL